MDVTELNDAITLVNSATSGANTVFNIGSGITINNGTANDFTTLISNTSQLSITDQNLIIDSGTISVENARAFSGATEGNVTATITSGSSIAEMLDETTGLIESDSYTITISSEDSKATAADLIALYGKTSVSVDATAVTQIIGTIVDSNIVYAAGTNEIKGLGDEL